MSVQARIHNLQEKKSKISRKIHEAYTNHLSDEILKKLKKRRLRIKDEISSLVDEA